MIRARLRVWLDRALEPLGYRRVAQCDYCERWFPLEGSGNWFHHVLCEEAALSTARGFDV